VSVETIDARLAPQLVIARGQIAELTRQRDVMLTALHTARDAMLLDDWNVAWASVRKATAFGAVTSAIAACLRIDADQSRDTAVQIIKTQPAGDYWTRPKPSAADSSGPQDRVEAVAPEVEGLQLVNQRQVEQRASDAVVLAEAIAIDQTINLADLVADADACEHATEAAVVCGGLCDSEDFRVMVAGHRARLEASFQGVPPADLGRTIRKYAAKVVARAMDLQGAMSAGCCEWAPAPTDDPTRGLEDGALVVVLARGPGSGLVLDLALADVPCRELRTANGDPVLILRGLVVPAAGESWGL
jgi:hypothetical protein